MTKRHSAECNESPSGSNDIIEKSTSSVDENLNAVNDNEKSLKKFRLEIQVHWMKLMIY